MDTNVEKQTSRFRWQRTTLQLSILVALVTTIYRGMDNYTMHNLIVSGDAFTNATVYLVLGGWTGFLIALVLTFTVGKVIEPDFQGLIVFDKTLQKSAFLTGVISAGSTLFVLMGNQFGDPTLIIALSTLTIIYVMFYEVLRKNQSLKTFLYPASIVVIGGLMAAYTGSFELTLLGVVYVVLVSNTLRAVSEIVEKTGATAGGALSMFIWRFFWLCVTGTIIAVVGALVRGTTGEYHTVFVNSLQYWPFILATMCVVWFANAYTLYMKRFNAVTTVLIVLSTQLIISFPLTILGDYFVKGAFGNVPSITQEPDVWLIRIVGALFIIFGVWLLKRTYPQINNRLGK